MMNACARPSANDASTTGAQKGCAALNQPHSVDFGSGKSPRALMVCCRLSGNRSPYLPMRARAIALGSAIVRGQTASGSGAITIVVRSLSTTASDAGASWGLAFESGEPMSLYLTRTMR